MNIIHPPNEIWREIFEYYTHDASTPQILSLRTVCKKWRRIIDRCTIWQTLANKYTQAFICQPPPIESFVDFLANIAQLAIPACNWKINNSSEKLYIKPEEPIQIRASDYYIIDRQFKRSGANLIAFKIHMPAMIYMQYTSHISFYCVDKSIVSATPSVLYSFELKSGVEHKIILHQKSKSAMLDIFITTTKKYSCVVISEGRIAISCGRDAFLEV